MAEPLDIPPRFVVEYERSADYKDCNVTGAQGGVTLAGDVFMQLFLDKNSDPTTIDIATDSFKSPNDLPISGTPVHPVRVLQAGMIMSRQTAGLLGKWLIDVSNIDLEAMSKLVPK